MKDNVFVNCPICRLPTSTKLSLIRWLDYIDCPHCEKPFDLTTEHKVDALLDWIIDNLDT